MIVLSIKEKLIVDGGILVESIGSCASDSTIEGGKEKIITFLKPETKKIRIIILKKVSSSEKETDLEHIKLDNIDFYKMEFDPGKYK